MISGFVHSQLKEANFRFISTTPTELGAAVLTFVINIIGHLIILAKRVKDPGKILHIHYSIMFSLVQLTSNKM